MLADIQAFLQDIANTPPESPQRQALAALGPGMAPLVNSMPPPAPDAHTASLAQTQQLLQIMASVQAQLVDIKATQAEQARKGPPEVPTLTYQALQTIASHAVDTITFNPEEGECVHAASCVQRTVPCFLV
jgi:hypothetical protein